jgi:tetratricopeptide (TPR) repeat protein
VIANPDRRRVLEEARRLQAAGELAAARRELEGLLLVDARDADVLCKLGSIAIDEGALRRAVELLSAATLIRPADAEAHCHLGTAYLSLNLATQAIVSFERACFLEPDRLGPRCSLAAALLTANRLDEAGALLESLLAKDPDCRPARQNLALVLEAQQRPDQARLELARAFATEPNHPEFRYADSHLRLRLGDFEAGFALYESRWHPVNRRPGSIQLPAGARCAQRLSEMADRRVLLHDEQGVGDAIQFIRYAALAASQARSIVVGVRPELKRLFGSLKGVQAVVGLDEPLPSYDLLAPLLSLPALFGTTLETIPAGVPYLSADPIKLQRWRERLGPGDHPRVGLTWRGNPAHPNDLNRSMPLELLVPMLDVAGIEFISLQQSEHADDRASAAWARLRHFGAELHDFAETAALASCMDLVISVDTSIAHLAGALALPVWVLLPQVGEWRWLQQRLDSPWYPTARLFRQARLGDWSDVIAGVCQGLRERWPLNFSGRVTA